MAVVVFSLSAWCQSSIIVKLGTEVIENNSLSSAKESFSQRGMPLEQLVPGGNYVYMSERPTLLAALNVTSSNKIKEVSFLCGAAMWWEIGANLDKAGFTLSKNSNVTLGNGAVVPQKTYVKGNILCLVQTLDNDMKQVIFKHKPVQSKKKLSSK